MVAQAQQQAVNMAQQQIDKIASEVQQQTGLNSLTKARGSLNEFAIYRGGIDNLTGPLTQEQNTAKNAISKINPTINNLTDAERVANELEAARKTLNPRSEEAKKLAEVFWPGSLTLVLKKKKSVPYTITAGKETVAVRVPNHQLTLELLKQLDL